MPSSQAWRMVNTAGTDQGLIADLIGDRAAVSGP